MNTWIGVDLGGTHLRAALADEKGTILQMTKVDTSAREGVEAVLGRIAAAIFSLPGWESAKGVGVGIPGGISRDGEKPMLATNLVGFDGYPVRKKLSGLIGKPVVLENDANLACLAEALLGAGRGKETVVYATVSTGVGGGICINEKIHRGVHGCAGEFGSMSCDPKRPRVGDLPCGAVESEASGEAVVRKAEIALKRSFSNAGEVYDLAKVGDGDAQALSQQVALDLAVMLSNIACVLDPDIVVLGGGCFKSADFILPRLQVCYREFAQPVFHDLPICLGRVEEPGLVGAALYARACYSI